MIARSLTQLRRAEQQLRAAAGEALRRRELASVAYHSALRACVDRGEESRLATAEALCQQEARDAAQVVARLRAVRQEIRNREEARHGDAVDG